jgi:hypothetical protein
MLLGENLQQFDAGRESVRIKLIDNRHNLGSLLRPDAIRLVEREHLWERHVQGARDPDQGVELRRRMARLDVGHLGQRHAHGLAEFCLREASSLAVGRTR